MKFFKCKPHRLQETHQKKVQIFLQPSVKGSFSNLPHQHTFLWFASRVWCVCRWRLGRSPRPNRSTWTARRTSPSSRVYNRWLFENCSNISSFKIPENNKRSIRAIFIPSDIKRPNLGLIHTIHFRTQYCDKKILR